MTVPPELLAHPNFDALATAVRLAFPDPRSSITDELVAAVAHVLPEDPKKQLFGDLVGLLADVAGRFAAHFQEDDGAVLGHYIARATHTRYDLKTGDLVHSFTGLLPMVHYELPGEQRDIPSKAGILAAGDMPLYDLPTFQAHYTGTALGKAKRVTVVSPARFLGARFGAIASMYAELPNGHGFVLVGGMATGESVVLYASQDGKAIERVGWYTPTPFSANANHYGGEYEVDDELAPKHLAVAVRAPTRPTHVTVDVVYSKVEPTSVLWPAELTMQAACRVAAIGQRLGKPMGSGIVLELVMPLLAEVGRSLDWLVKPGMVHV